MLALLTIFGSTFVTSLSGALMPGPLFTLSIREALRRGFWAGPLLAFGHCLVELALVIGLALGLSEFLDEGKGTAAIAIVGGLFLLWMGYQMVRTAPRQELRFSAEPSTVDDAVAVGGASGSYRSRLFATISGGDAAAVAPKPMPSLLMPAGALISIANPYWIVWWATIGMSLISESLEQGIAGVGTFFTAHILTDIVWLSLVAFALVSGRRLMSGRAYRAILLVCGLFLLVLGGQFIYSGIGFFA